VEVGGIDAAPAARGEVCLPLLIVDEGDDRREVRVGEGEGWHALTWSPGADDRSEPIAAQVFGHERGARQIGAARTAGCIASVAEAALRRELRAAGFNLCRGILLGDLGLRRSLRCGTRLPAALRRGRWRRRTGAALRNQGSHHP
jgi:hypothetical protein